MKNICNSLEKIFINVDFLSPQIGFEFNGSNHYKNIAGGFYSLIIIGLTIAMTIIFSSDIYLRTNPSIISYLDAVDNSEINLKDFPLFISFGDASRLRDDFANMLKVSIVAMEFLQNSTITLNTYDNVLEVCNKSHYNFPENSNVEANFNNQLKGIYCIKPLETLSFKNLFTTTNSKFLNLKFEYCNPTTSPNCPKNIEEIVPLMFIGIFYMNSFPNSPNFNSPIMYKVDSFVSKLNIGLMKRVFLSFIQSQFISDDGLIFPSEKTIKHVEFYSSTADFYLKLDKPDRFVYNITFDSPRIARKIQRKYVKVQDILSNVGGFTAIMIVILQFLSKSHLRFNYLSFIRILALEEDNNSNKLLELSCSPVLQRKKIPYKDKEVVNNSVKTVKANHKRRESFEINKSNNLFKKDFKLNKQISCNELKTKPNRMLKDEEQLGKNTKNNIMRNNFIASQSPIVRLF